VDVSGRLDTQLAQASPDLLRAMLKTFAEALMSAEADAVCGAAYAHGSPDRVNRRNRSRQRDWDTRAGTVELEIPTLRQGSYFPDWLLERRRRAEQALVTVVATSYLLGVSTPAGGAAGRDPGRDPPVEGAGQPDGQEPGRAGGRVGQPAAGRWPVRVGVAGRADAHGPRARPDRAGPRAAGGRGNADGQREVLGLDVASGEDGAGWLAFLRGLVARGLAGLQPVTSDSHPGLVEAVGATLPGASWQRCRTRYARNLATKAPKNAQPWVLTLPRTVFDQPDADQVAAQVARVVDALQARFPAAAEHLAAAEADLLAFTAFPCEVWRQVWSNNPQERLNREVRRRTDVVGIFPDRDAIVRLVGAVLMERTDEWAEQRRYMGLEILAKARRSSLPADDRKEVPAAITA
jgi:putative transposase